MNAASHVAIEGSRRDAPTAERLGPVDPEQVIEVSVYLRRPAATPRADAGPTPGSAHLTRAELADRGADPADVATVERVAAAHDLAVVAIQPERFSMQLRGTVAALSAAFDVELSRYPSPTGEFRGREGVVAVPVELDTIVTAVLGLDDRPAARPHIRFGWSRPTAFQPAVGPAAGFTPPEVATAYRFPTGVDGTGQCVALIELGGGYAEADLQHYFSGLGVPLPSVVAVGVDGSTNTPTGDASSADGEVVLDIEVAGAVAPGARVAVYFAPNTDRGFADAVLAAVHDDVNRPTVISISWGQAEDAWTASARTVMEDAFAAAQAIGLTVFAAAGDNGSGDSVGDGLAHVDYPAASARVVGCGGTTLTVNGSTVSQTVWANPSGGATGGGVSAVEPVPAYQSVIDPVSANPPRRPGRGVPDVSGDADPATGYKIFVDGTSMVVGGTSAVAPLWAGLTALLQQQAGRSISPLLPALYAAPQAFSDITDGSNGAYDATPGWDACTGLGTPLGDVLSATVAAPNPV